MRQNTEDDIQARKLKIQAEEEREKQRQQEDQRILAKFEAMLEKEQKQILRDFEKYLKGDLYLNIYQRDELKNILIQDQFSQFIKNEKGVCSDA
jgi:hypothetical protein